MTSRGSVSVCMATYNGARFVAEQAQSILDQLDWEDELVVVDDASTDNTVEELNSLRDPRIVIYVLPSNVGHVRAFEIALYRSRHEHVFLSDQDDTWPRGRLETMQTALSGATLVVGNVVTPDGIVFRPAGTRTEFRLHDQFPSGQARSIALLALSQLPYHGCAMGLRRELLDAALPFPPAVKELHDAWLGLIGLTTGSVAHLAAPVVIRREHGDNLSGTVRKAREVARGRFLFIRMLMAALRRRRPIHR